MDENTNFDSLFLKEALNQKRDLNLKVVSDSMTPLIKVGQSVKLSACEVSELKIFDIIIYEQAGKLNCHFLVGKDLSKDEFITRSFKHADSSDFPIKAKQIIGKVSDVKLSFWHKLKVSFKALRS